LLLNAHLLPCWMFFSRCRQHARYDREHLKTSGFLCGFQNHLNQLNCFHASEILTSTHTQKRQFNGPFPGESALASCSLILRGDYCKNLWVPILAQWNQQTHSLDLILSSSQGKRHHFLCVGQQQNCSRRMAKKSVVLEFMQWLPICNMSSEHICALWSVRHLLQKYCCSTSAKWSRIFHNVFEVF